MSICVCMKYIYIYTHTLTHTYTEAYIYMCVSVCVCMCVHTYIHTYIQKYICMNMHIYIAFCFIGSILLNGWPTWTLTKHIKKKVDINCTRMLRAILNKSWKRCFYKILVFSLHTVKWSQVAYSTYWYLNGPSSKYWSDTSLLNFFQFLSSGFWIMIS